MDFFKAILLGSFCVTLISCGPKIVFEKTVSFDQEYWSYGDSLNFEFSVKDTTMNYDLIVEIGHNSNFPYQNVYSNISTNYPDGTRQDQILSFELAEKTGKWYGKCKDEACTFIVPLQSAVRFDQLGTYNIEFDQYSRTDSLWGFNDFTLRLTESITK